MAGVDGDRVEACDGGAGAEEEEAIARRIAADAGDAKRRAGRAGQPVEAARRQPVGLKTRRLERRKGANVSHSRVANGDAVHQGGTATLGTGPAN